MQRFAKRTRSRSSSCNATTRETNSGRLVCLWRHISQIGRAAGRRSEALSGPQRKPVDGMRPRCWSNGGTSKTHLRTPRLRYRPCSPAGSADRLPGCRCQVRPGDRRRPRHQRVHAARAHAPELSQARGRQTRSLGGAARRGSRRRSGKRKRMLPRFPPSQNRDPNAPSVRPAAGPRGTLSAIGLREAPFSG